MLAWLRDLNPRERRTMLACFGGWTLDGFDGQLYSYVVPTVIALWGISAGTAGTIGTVTGLSAGPQRVKGGCRRQVDCTAGLPSAPEMPCAPRQLRFVPQADVTPLQKSGGQSTRPVPA